MDAPTSDLQMFAGQYSTYNNRICERDSYFQRKSYWGDIGRVLLGLLGRTQNVIMIHGHSLVPKAAIEIEYCVAIRL